MSDNHPVRLRKWGMCLALAIMVLPTGKTLIGQEQPKSAPPLLPPTSPPAATPDTLPPQNLPSQPQSPVAQPQPAIAQPTSDAVPPLPRVPLQIDPKTPLKDLLPLAPKMKKPAILVENLNQVPEIEFQASPTEKLPLDRAATETVHTITKINHLNQRKRDGFLDLLLGERQDLKGLPFAMGDACRTQAERSKQFNLAVATVRRAMPAMPGALPATTRAASARANPNGREAIVPFGLIASENKVNSDNFWDQYDSFCLVEDRAESKIDRTKCEHITQARIAALMQILAPESADVRLGLVRYLSGVAHVDATRSLAAMAIYSAEDEVRFAACDALKVRREKDYTDALLAGLRYPLPAVARRAAEAIAKLERHDLLPHLLTMLEVPDPRAPTLQEVNHQKTPVVREMVKINHHRSCLLCHAPGNTGTVSDDVLTVSVPIPGGTLSPPSGGYNNNSDPDLLVRIDVTYLRQDFSMFQVVPESHPWPEMQRFDFLVRTRVLTNDEAVEFNEKLELREPGVLSPYHRAALVALRELTGKDTEPTAKAWRQLLKLPASSN